MSATEKHSQDRASNIIDLIKLICCVLIVGNHALPIFTDNIMNHYYCAWFFRFCVPFFFIATGYFAAKMDPKKRTSYIVRIAVLYLIAAVIYLPEYIGKDGFNILYYFFFQYNHLWYLRSLAAALLILEAVNPRLGNKRYILFLLLPIAIFFDEYYRLFDSAVLFEISYLTDNLGILCLFRTIPMLLAGDFICNKKISAPVRYCAPAFVLLMILGFFEARFLIVHLDIDTTLHAVLYGVTPDASIFAWMPAVPLFLIGIKTPSFLKASTSRSLRKVVDIVYIIHVWLINILGRYFGIHNFTRFILVTVLSFIIGAIISFCMSFIGKMKK